ncbi:MAG: NAD-dependent epimerase/dehydratase family protein [Candidatus Dadabacteria bacterium]|nr:MAG: NAD-dependent epimerase/dehydratase family protein [Candidatus Dadabacteria bacterium]
MFSLRDQTVAVTGATGFVGHYLVRVLLERGAHVVALARNPDNGLAFTHPNLELRRFDLTQPATIAPALRDANVLYHNAALISIGRQSWARLAETNIEGTRRVFAAAAEAGVQRAVLTSSASVYRPKPDHDYGEDDPLWQSDDKPNRTRWYGKTKAEAERVALEIAADADIHVAIARPQMIFGAWCRDGFSAAFEKLMRSPVAVKPLDWRFPAVYAGDLAEAMMRMAERDSANGRAYNIAAPPNRVDYVDHVRAWRLAGGQIPRVQIPVPLPVRRSYQIHRAQHDLNWRPRTMRQAYEEKLALMRGDWPPHDPTLCDLNRAVAA